MPEAADKLLLLSRSALQQGTTTGVRWPPTAPKNIFSVFLTKTTSLRPSPTF